MMWLLGVWLCVTALGAGDECEGFKPLGGHTEPSGSVLELAQFPSPEEFHRSFAGEGVPFVVRGAAKLHPAAELWTDEYLTATYGTVKVEWEEGKKEDRNLELFEWPLAQFVENYKTVDGYCVWDVNDKMKADFRLPEPLLCGGYHRRLSSVLMWFSSGGTKSVLHNDVFENINCIFDGTKDIIMINRSHAGLMESPAAGWDPQSNSVPGSRIDVDAVDTTRYPALGQFEYTTVTMNKGDCLYIPSQWYHQVRSHGPRNLAINVWFYRMAEFDSGDCAHPDRVARRRKRKLSKFKWLSTAAVEDGLALDSVHEFAEVEGFFRDGFQMTRSHLALVMAESLPSVDSLFVQMDENRDGVVTMDELALDADDDNNGDDGGVEWHIAFHQAWTIARHVNSTKLGEAKHRKRARDAEL